MIINLGRLMMVVIWAFLLFNLVKPFPVPGNYFLYVGLAFMTVMHGLKMMMLKAMVLPGQPKPTAAELWRIFIFGVFELMAWQKKQRLAEETHRRTNDGKD